MKKLANMKIDEKLEYYGELPYTIQLIENADGTYFGSIKELRGCMTEGETKQEALEMLEDAKSAWLEIAIEDGDEIPLPESLISKEYSGKFNIRIPKSLHRRLSENAELEGVSLNTHTLAILESGNTLMHLLKEKGDFNKYLILENSKLKNEVSELKQEGKLFQRGYFISPKYNYEDFLAGSKQLTYKTRN